MKNWATPSSDCSPLPRAAAVANTPIHTDVSWAPPPTPTSKHFKRSYQACLNCRKKKIKCDLGSPDAPSHPPCARCKREQRECVFGGPRASTKKKAKPTNLSKIPGQEDVIGTTRASPRSLKPLHSYSVSKAPLGVTTSPVNASKIGSASHEVPQNLNLRTPNSPNFHDAAIYQPPAKESIDDPTDPLLTSHIRGTNDAMDLLFRAAERLEKSNSSSSSIVGRNEEEQAETDPDQVYGQHQYIPLCSEPERTIMDTMGKAKRRRGVMPESLKMSSYNHFQSCKPLPSRPVKWLFKSYPGEKLSVALEAWKRFRLVHQGWLTPLECFTFVNFFHQTLICHSPILDNHFALPSSQLELIADEPVLAMTILTIAARYCPLSGHGGISRSHYLHERFCTYAQGLIGRVIWGQTRIGPYEGEVTRKNRGKGIRGLGTVESLLLWSDWHSRGMHFPPVDGDHGLAGEGWDVSLIVEEPTGRGGKSPSSNKWREEVMEPTWRSDRLSWMLLGTAFTLAHELGIFDSNIEDDAGAPTIPFQQATNPRSTPVQNSTTQVAKSETFRRIARLRKLCYIYLHTLSTRLNWTSILDNNRSLFQLTGFLASAQGEPYMTKYEEKWHKVMSNWIELTHLTKSATDMLFSSKKLTQSLIWENRHLSQLEHLNSAVREQEDKLLRLNEWIEQNAGNGAVDGDQNTIKNKMENCGLIVPKPFWNIILIEFLYLKVFINSIALEALAERNWRKAASRRLHKPGVGAELEICQERMILHSGGQDGFEAQEWEYVLMAFESGMELLKIILEGADCEECCDHDQVRGETNNSDSTLGDRMEEDEWPKCEGDVNGDCGRGHWLRYAPVRIFVRLIYAAIFLMKTTTVMGPHTSRSMMCYSLLRKVIIALRRSAVDDVHLANKFSALLEAHLAALIAKGRHTLRVRLRTKVPCDSEAKNSQPPSQDEQRGEDAMLMDTTDDGEDSRVVTAKTRKGPGGRQLDNMGFPNRGRLEIDEQKNTALPGISTFAPPTGDEWSSSPGALSTDYPLSFSRSVSLPYSRNCTFASLPQKDHSHIHSPDLRPTSPILGNQMATLEIPDPGACATESQFQAWPRNGDDHNPLTPCQSPPEMYSRNYNQPADLELDMDAMWEYEFHASRFRFGRQNPREEPCESLEQGNHGEQVDFRILDTFDGMANGNLCAGQNVGSDESEPAVWDFLWSFNMVG